MEAVISEPPEPVQARKQPMVRNTTGLADTLLLRSGLSVRKRTRTPHGRSDHWAHSRFLPIEAQKPTLGF
jgi:hypothetical protein